MQKESVLRLFWIDACPGEPIGWRAALAPEIDLTVVDPDRITAADIAEAAGDRPFALLGCDHAAVPAFELARALQGTRSPACLMVAGEVAPDAGEVSCPVVAFIPTTLPPAGQDGDDLAGRWQSLSGSRIAVRRLPADRFRDRPARETVLAVKEELRVWPN